MKLKVKAVCSQPCGQRRIFGRFRKLRKTRKCPCVKGFGRFGSAWSDERYRAPKPGAIPTSLYPDIHFSAMIPRRAVKIKFFLSAVKAAFVPFSATGGNPANARICVVSPCPVPDTATALPNQARYQLRYTRVISLCWPPKRWIGNIGLTSIVYF